MTIQTMVIIVKVNTILVNMKYVYGQRCLVEMQDGEIISTTSKLEVQREHFSLPWASHFIICDVNGRRVNILHYFSIIHTTV